MPYQTLNQITINSQALKNNYHYFQHHNPQAYIAPVLKANAYGHGLHLISKWIDTNLNPPFICVDSLYEAYELTKIRIKTPILILGYTDPKNFKIWKRLKNISFPVFDEETLSLLNQYQPGAKIHLKIDTGMNRLGVQPNRVGEWFNLLKKYNQVQIEGIYSHLSQADDINKSSFTTDQVQLFKQVIRKFESRGVRFKWKHLAATAAASPHAHDTSHASHTSHNSLTPHPNPNHITAPEFNLIRLGLGFYGYSPFSFGKIPELRSPTRGGAGEFRDLKPPKQPNKTPQDSRLETLDSRLSTQDSRLTTHHSITPALTLTSKLAQVKRVGEESQISYGGTYITKKPSTIGILPIGYSDGLPRTLSNLAQFTTTNNRHSQSPINQRSSKTLLKQKVASHTSCTSITSDTSHLPVLGRICMNMTMLDLTNTFSHDSRLKLAPRSLGEVGTQDSITIISPNPTHPNSVYNLAKQAKTIPYEILTNLNPTIKRTLK